MKKSHVHKGVVYTLAATTREKKPRIEPINWDVAIATVNGKKEPSIFDNAFGRKKEIK
ncbi:MAG TPA: hypothetical protein VN698_16415 [Bacteroidia bacterium]|nr:hypothetical protein [Bacteroidia bacterium]